MQTPSLPPPGAAPAPPGDAQLRAWRESLASLDAQLRSTLSASLLPPREHARLSTLAKATQSARQVLASDAR